MSPPRSRVPLDDFILPPSAEGTAVMGGKQPYMGYPTPAAHTHDRVAVKSITVETPSASEDDSIFYTTENITISKIVAVVKGSSPSITWTIRHDPDRSASGNEVVTGGTTTTDATTGDIVTSFDDETIPANSFVWLETTAMSGTVEFVQVTLFYTVDSWLYSKCLTVVTPGASEDVSAFYIDEDITITEMLAVLIGSSTPSVTWTIRHNASRAAAGNEVVTSGTTTTDTTTGDSVTSFDDATIPADSFVWFETTAQSGTVDEFHVTIFYTKDG